MYRFGIGFGFASAILFSELTPDFLSYTFIVSQVSGSIDFKGLGTKSWRNPPDCMILGNWAFENFILAERLFAKALHIFKIYVLVNNNLFVKPVS